jgi:hypothetical protein
MQKAADEDAVDGIEKRFANGCGGGRIDVPAAASDENLCGWFAQMQLLLLLLLQRLTSDTPNSGYYSTVLSAASEMTVSLVN